MGCVNVLNIVTPCHNTEEVNEGPTVQKKVLLNTSLLVVLWSPSLDGGIVLTVNDFRLNTISWSQVTNTLRRPFSTKQ